MGRVLMQSAVLWRNVGDDDKYSSPVTKRMSSDSEMSSNYQFSSDPEEEDFVDSEDEDIAVV